MGKKIRKWLFIIFLVYCGSGAAVYFFQDKLLFHPEKLDASYSFRFKQPFREINLPVSKERNLSIVQFMVPDSNRKGVVLYFHGNRRNILRYADYAEHFRRNQYEVWMIDYPGFGKSTGKISEKLIYEDADLFYRMAIAKTSADSIIIYGKSIGTGPASYLASHVSCKSLILETPYYSIGALANRYFFIYPVLLMSEYSFPVHSYLETTTAPITIFHGTRDGTIPHAQSSKLKKENPQIKLVTIKGGRHNNLSSYNQFHSSLDSLLQ